MSKTRTHEVTAKKGEKRMVITKEFLLKADRHARWLAAHEQGLDIATGSGVHGGDDRTRNRRDRTSTKQKLRRGNYDE